MKRYIIRYKDITPSGDNIFKVASYVNYADFTNALKILIGRGCKIVCALNYDYLHYLRSDNNDR